MNGPKAAIAIAVTTALIAALLLLACGQRKASTGQGAVTQRQQTATSNLQPHQSAVSGELARLHRPRTWQSTKGFTAGEDYLPDQIAVKFFDELPQGLPNAGAGGQPSYNPSSVLYQNPEHAEYARSLANSYGLSVMSGQEAFAPGMNFCAYQIPSGEDAEALMQRILDENPQTVRYVEYVATRKAAYVPDDPGLSDQWHHSTINSYDTWDYGTGSSNVIVAVIDTGVDLDHPDLVGNLIDVESQYQTEIFDRIDGDNNPEDENGHGTHVAGLACAVGDNNQGVAGVAYNCSIMPVRVLGPTGGTSAQVSAGITLAVSVNPYADVVNLSLGGYFPSRIEREACEYAYINNVIVIASAGNENCIARIAYPAGAPTVMAVGATDKDDHKATYSNYGWWVDIAAPGGEGINNPSTAILSTWMNADYASIPGTSMASPIVAGAAALLKSIDDNFYNFQYRAFLEASGMDLPDSEWGENLFIRRLDVGAAMAYELSSWPTVEITEPANNAQVSGLTTIKFSCSDDEQIMGYLLYIDGVWVDGGYEQYQFDFTNYEPGECSIIAEVIDQDYQHTYHEIYVQVTNPIAYPIPYRTSFTTIDEGWGATSFSGLNYWDDIDDGSGGTMLELNFAADDVSWLESPNLSPNGASQCRLVFWGEWSDESAATRAWLRWSQGDLFGEDGSYISFAKLQPLSDEYPSLPGIDNYWYVDISPQGNTPIKVLFGLDPFKPELESVSSGYIRIDDFWLTKPTNPPTVSITAPATGQQVSGNVTFSATASDDWFVLTTQFYADGNYFASDDTAAYSASFNSALYPNGSLLLDVEAYDLDWYDGDSDGNPWDYTVASRTVFVANQKITSLTPSTGYFGDKIKVIGSGFANYRPGSVNTVTFTGVSGPINAAVALWSENQIEVIVPEGCISGPVNVWIDGGYAQSPENFTLSNPYTSLHFDAPDANLMFNDDFAFEVHAQPDLDSVDVTIKEYPLKSQHFETQGSSAQITGYIDVTGLTTGTYYLQATGHVGTSSSTIERRIYLNTLPGDFDSSGEVNDDDAAYLRNYIDAHGEVRSNNAQFIPFLDTNGDGCINEQDLAYVGYWFGTTLG